MGAIPDKRLGAVRMLIEQAPDRVVQGLRAALDSRRQTGPMAEVQSLVSAEMADRRLRDGVFGPLTPLCRDTDKASLLSPAAPRLLWSALKTDQPAAVAEARRATQALRRDDGPPPIYDELCRRAAEGLRDRNPPFDQTAALLEAGSAGGLDRLIAGLGLTSLARALLPRVPSWVRSMDGDSAAAVRLAFKDATEIDDNCAPTFMAMIHGQLEDAPWQILRVISAVMDRPSDRYLAASEMAEFGERLLDDMDQRIAAVRAFDANEGPKGAVLLAASIHTATIIISEFEQWLDIAKDGPWGLRLAKAKKALAASVESRLKETPAAVAAALPAAPAHSSGKSARMIPRTTADLDKDAVRRAYALLTFLSESRSSAAHGGFAAKRSKILEDLDKQISVYGDDLIDSLHGGGDQAERLHAYIEVAADFLGLVRDPKAAEIVRRRAAVA